MCNYESILERNELCAFSEKYVTTKDNKQVLYLSQETCKDSARKKILPVFSEINTLKNLNFTEMTEFWSSVLS